MHALKLAFALTVGVATAAFAADPAPPASSCPTASHPAASCPAASCEATARCSVAGCPLAAAFNAAVDAVVNAAVTVCPGSACCPTDDCCPTACTGPASDCCVANGCCDATAMVNAVAAISAPAPANGCPSTCGVAAPSTAVAVCSATSLAPPPAPQRLTTCAATACPLSVCGAGVCGTNSCGLDFTVEVADADGASVCLAPSPVCGAPNCPTTVCPCPVTVCGGAVWEMSPCETRAPVAPEETLNRPSWTATAALAAPVSQGIFDEPAGLYGVRRTAAVEDVSARRSVRIAPAAYATPIAAPPGLPVGRWTRTLNDQSVTVAVAADGTFTATCTVPNSGCSLTIAGDCRATADGLLFGVVTSAKAAPSGSDDAAAVDPMACLEVESFCRSLIDQPFSARCRVGAPSQGKPSMNVSNALFGGIGFVGIPAPGEPAHLALTMFSGAYEAE